MSYFFRLLVCNALLACCLSACSSPGARAREHAAAFARMSPADQQLVRHGRIRPGMNQEAVYIAWGEPDAKIPGGDGKAATQTWVYRQRVTVLEPPNSYYYTGPYHGFGTGWAGRGFLPDYTYGGIGYEGTLRYQPHVRSLDAVRVAEFSGGKVDHYKGADGTWSAPQRTAARIVHHTVSSARPHVAARTGGHHGSKTRVSRAAPHGHGTHHPASHAHSHAPGKVKTRPG